MKKERPILFSTPMVRAILEGRKTMTRRNVNPRVGCSFLIGTAENDLSDIPWFYHNREVIAIDEEERHIKNVFCPYGEIGDILWVRETWSPKYVKGGLEGFRLAYPNDYPWTYLADDPSAKAYGNGEPWKPSIHMPKAAARIWLEVTDIRVERLHDISPGDACDEGINYWNIDGEALEGGELQADFENYDWRDDPKYEDYHFPTYANPVSSFFSLWKKINGKESLESNPWVWVVSFKVLSKTGKPKGLSLNTEAV